ncbi:MAG: hypothetical protein WCT03_19090 [Candidatus Obscuribacterales bacterium]|jgi:hypothetical protein
MSGANFGRLAISLSLGLASLSMACSQCFALPNAGVYTPINIEEVRSAAKSELRNARAAGRLTAEETKKMHDSLTDANSLEAIESTWAQMEARAQEVKSNHLSIDHLIKQFSLDIDKLVKDKTLTVADAKFYRDRIDGMKRLQKQFTANGHRLDFWQFNVLAIDLSSVQERLTRALVRQGLSNESIDDLILRSDLYMARNAVCARQLNTYKSYIVEPELLLRAKNELYSALKDRAHSKVTTPEVRAHLQKRLMATHYEAGRIQPSQEEIDYAISEVQRLIDGGIKNGNLGHTDATRLQQELELVKAINKSYPGPNPGVDPFEKELRFEEVRFMASDIRFLQDWLARLLRKDGDTDQSREQILTIVRRADLAFFTHRIAEADVVAILNLVSQALRTEDKVERLAMLKEGQGKLDMMIADYSWKPVDVAVRVEELNKMIAKLKNAQGEASAERDRIEAILRTLPQSSSPEKVGANIVAGSELELLRSKVASLLKEEQKTANETNQ